VSTKSREFENHVFGRLQIPVYYEDTDFSGYVYHANYLKFFERAREELIGRQYLKELYERQVHYVVYKMDITFHAPSHHGDTITVDTEFIVSASSVAIAHQTCNLLDPNDPSVVLSKLCTAKIKLATVNGEGRPIRVPQDILDYFLAKSKQGKSFEK